MKTMCNCIYTNIYPFLSSATKNCASKANKTIKESSASHFYIFSITNKHLSLDERS